MAEAIIEIKNSEAKLVDLRTEANSVSIQLASAYSELDNVKKQKEAIDLEVINAVKSLNLIVSKRLAEENRILELKSDFSKKQDEHRFVLNNSDKESKSVIRELNKINLSLISARDEENTMKDKLKGYDDKIKSQKPLIDSILALENEKKGLEKEKDLARLDLDILIKTKNDELASLQKDMNVVLKKINALKQDTEAAIYAKKKVEDECFRIKSDLDEYKQRIELAWAQVFPGRNMPML